jgi:GNAT superfamily N-acetyltransferase
VALRRLAPDDAARAVPALAELLIDCVEGGASVGFMAPLTFERSTRFWQSVSDGVARGERALLVAEDAAGVVGTVQLLLATPENQPHRADVAKMLVHRRARRRGVARRLMQAVEEVARDEGRTLLVLDTVTGSAADRLYTESGWRRVGEIPDYALMPDGAPCATTVFYKAIGRGHVRDAGAS